MQEPDQVRRWWFISLFRAAFFPDYSLTADELASTLFRFFRSKHVRDLMIIAKFISVLFVIYVVGVLAVAEFHRYKPPYWTPTAGSEAAAAPASSGTAHPAASGTGLQTAADLFEFLAKYLGPAFGVAGLVIAWAYRSASARLGVVDLFACEIGTLCRVGTIVDVGKQYVDEYSSPPTQAEKPASNGKEAAAADPFVSREDYFPILQTNARDLQLLEALVVAHITEFYTYVKAMRDMLRKLAADGPRTKTEHDAWHSDLANVIYMLFLGYESGRRAIEDLIEFQPTRAENRVVILLTELKCYGFLLTHMTDKHHYPRLQLREENYKQIVPKLYHDVIHVSHGQNQKYWSQAGSIARELRNRYKNALHESMPDAMTRLRLTFDNKLESEMDAE